MLLLLLIVPKLGLENFLNNPLNAVAMMLHNFILTDIYDAIKQLQLCS